MPSLHRL
ncbi:predicted protein [Fibroporia radiculosa]|nr:predicted protein [Fibroporia radiculosa]